MGLDIEKAGTESFFFRIRLRAPADIVLVRQAIRALALELHYSLIAQTTVVAAADELARYALTCAGDRAVQVGLVAENARNGVRAVFTTSGRASYPRFSGRPLVDAFDVVFAPGQTRTTFTKWEERRATCLPSTLVAALP